MLRGGWGEFEQCPKERAVFLGRIFWHPPGFPTSAFEEVRIFGHPRGSQLTFEMFYLYSLDLYFFRKCWFSCVMRGYEVRIFRHQRGSQMSLLRNWGFLSPLGGPKWHFKCLDYLPSSQIVLHLRAIFARNTWTFLLQGKKGEKSCWSGCNLQGQRNKGNYGQFLGVEESVCL